MKSIEVEGKNIEDAIKKGLDKLGLARNQVEIKILQEGSRGLFNLKGAESAKIRIIVKK